MLSLHNRAGPTIVMIDVIMENQVQVFSKKMPKFVWSLQIFGKAGAIIITKDGNVEDHGVTCIFVGYALEQNWNCYCIPTQR